MNATQDTPLPMTVIGGFLGAGKTTLVNRWLRGANGVRLAVLVNDFGALNIDADLISPKSGGDGGIEGAPAQLMQLSNGCVCCQIGDDLSLALMSVLDRRERIDAIVVEASGVSDPWRVAQFARADPALSLDGVVVLVDASMALAQSRDALLADTLHRQLASADLVVLNKADLASAQELGDLKAWIAGVAGPVTCFETTQSDVPVAMLSRLAMPQARQGHDHVDGQIHDCAHPHSHHHAHGDPSHGQMFDTWSAHPEAAFDADTLRAWLKQPPAGLLRLKGFVRNRNGGWLTVQFAGRHGSVRSASAPAADQAAVVAISLRERLPRDALASFFAPDKG